MQKPPSFEALQDWSLPPDGPHPEVRARKPLESKHYLGRASLEGRTKSIVDNAPINAS